MPRYDYKCPECGHVVELQNHVEDRDKPVYCPMCDTLLNRVLAQGMAILWGMKGSLEMQGKAIKERDGEW